MRSLFCGRWKVTYFLFPRGQLKGVLDGDQSMSIASCLSSVFSSNPCAFFHPPCLLSLIKYTHFIFKIKIYSVCNKNIESAHLRTSSHLKTVEHISNKKIYDTSGTSQSLWRLRKEMRPLFIFCFKCLEKVPEIPGSTCVV